MNGAEESFDIEKPRGFWLLWLKRIGWSLLILAILFVGRQSWVHYRATKALQEMSVQMDATEPGWRLEDIEAAREQVPEEENSARVVVAATRLLPKNWPSQEFDDQFAHLIPVEQLDPDDFARLKKVLEELRPALEQARKLADMPRGRHHIAYKRNVIETLLTDQAEGRRVSRLLVLDAMRRDQQGDPKNALISCRAVLNTARALGDEPLAISQLVRTAGVVAACQAVERSLAQGEPPPAEMIAFQRLLEKEDAFPDLFIAARGERAMDQALFDAIESGDVAMGELAGGRAGWGDRLFGFLYRDTIRDEHPLMLTRMSRWVAIARLPPHEQADAEQQLDQEMRELPKSAILTRLLFPAFAKLGEASRRKHACIRCMTSALAAERYRREHGAWPDTLDKLCPGFLTAVLLDPFDGEPLRYRHLDDGVMIYSVGNDSVDNDGNLDPKHPNQPGVDVGCRLWAVAKRRQPPQPKPPPNPD